MTAPADKMKTFEEWMKGDHVLLHLDSRREKVEVPAHLAGNSALTLKVSYLFQGTTEHNDEGVTAYLRFSGNYERCVIPWAAIWGMSNDKGEQKIWAEDLPAEILSEIRKLQQSSPIKQDENEPPPNAVVPAPVDLPETHHSGASPEQQRSKLHRIK